MTTAVIITCRLRAPEHRARFLALSRETKAWLEARPGFLRYELFEGDGTWTDTMLWDSGQAALAGNRAFAETPLAAAFADLVEPDPRGFAGAAVNLSESAP